MAKAIKGQTLADFIVELKPEAEKEEGTWKVHVDGSVRKNRNGEGILAESPTKTRIELAIHFLVCGNK